MRIDRHLVSYSAYCKKCVHYDKDGWKEPCNPCLSHPVNFGTDQPLYFKEKKDYGTTNRKKKVENEQNEQKG